MLQRKVHFLFCLIFLLSELRKSNKAMGKQLTELYAENQRKSEHIQKVENLLKKYETESSSQSSLQGSQNSITNPNEMNGNESKINGHGVENQNQNLDENSDERVSDLESELNVE